MKIEPIEHGKYYHIYNRGINGTKLFNEIENYRYFLRLYEKYIEPITETYAWCLMGNHFHLLVRIKELNEIKNLSGLRDPKGLELTSDLSGFQNPKGLLTQNPNFIITNQFSKFFNAYAKAFNNRYKRTGSLFEKPFERKSIDNFNYFMNLIFYIHYNPVHHGFCERLQDYPWSSYGSVISIKPTKIEREKTIGYFDTVGNFIDYHKQKHDLNNIRGLFFD
jgi:putative transposase